MRCLRCGAEMVFAFNETSGQIVSEVWKCPSCGRETKEPLEKRWIKINK